jgi:hypothetical protein
VQETYYVPTTNPDRLMLFGETVAVYCENHTEHTRERENVGGEVVRDTTFKGGQETLSPV